MTYLSWILSILAVWLMAAPFTLGYQETTAAMQNDLAVGAVLLIAGVYGIYRTFTGSEGDAHMQPKRG
jgi:Na+/H+-translocating membrane pyrophosphatase